MPVDHPPIAVLDRGGPEQSRIGAGGIGLGHAEGGLQIAGQQRMQVALLLLLGPGQGEDLRVAGIRRRVTEGQRRDRAGAEDLVHEAELDLAEPLAPELGIEVCRPQILSLDLLPQRRHRPLEAVKSEFVDQCLQRPDPLPDELLHPVELALEVRVGGEVPGHGGSVLFLEANQRLTFRCPRDISIASPPPTRPSFIRKAPRRTCTSVRC